MNVHDTYVEVYVSGFQVWPPSAAMICAMAFGFLFMLAAVLSFVVALRRRDPK